MSTAHVLFRLLWALGATEGATKPSASGEQTIEILIAGPEEARQRMDAAIRPLFSGGSDIRWTTEEQVPTNRALPSSGEPGPQQTWQIWIDVTNPLRLRLYLPASTQGATTVRTLTRSGAAGKDGPAADESTRQAVAQIVKTAVAALRHEDELPQAVATVSRRATDDTSQPEPAHDGFFLRVQAGYGTFTATDDYNDEQYSKPGPTFKLAVGHALIPNLILYGELLATAAINTNDRAGSNPEDHLGHDLVMWGVGPGVAYYLMPWNLYASATLGLAKILFVHGYTDNPLPDTDLGYVGVFSIGKEWWTGQGWGVGIAGQFSHAGSMNHPIVDTSVPYSNAVVDSNMRATTFSLSFSATYN